MLSKLLFKKKLGFPFVSVFLLLSCLLVTLPTYFSLKYYFLFGASATPSYPWQNPITSQLEHGSYLGELTGDDIPMLVYLLANVLVILLCGVLTERLLGTSRFLLLSITAGLVSYLLTVIFRMYENGASGIAWAYGPFAFIVLVKLFKKDRRRLLKEVLFYVFIILLFLMWVVSSLLAGLSTLLFHLASTAVGAGFLYLWRADIHDRIRKAADEEELPALTNHKLAAFSALLPIFVIVLLVLSWTPMSI